MIMRMSGPVPARDGDSAGRDGEPARHPRAGEVTGGDLASAVAAYRDGLADGVCAVVRQVAGIPAIAARLAEASLDPAGPTCLDDLDELPILTKDDLIAAQGSDPPFGGLLAGGGERVERVFQSPGPLYEPQMAGPDPWRWEPALTAAGFGPQDTVLNCFGYHLSPAGAMFELGCLAVGARVVPGGIGNQDLQAGAIGALPVTAYTGLPSYLKALIDRYESAGAEEVLGPWRLIKAVVTAEPLPQSLRDELHRRVPVVRMAYGTAEAGLIAYETQDGQPMYPGTGLLVEVCDLDTGLPISDGEGQVVVTLLRRDYPLVRFGTGDLSAWGLDQQGRLGLVGVLGRVGQAVKVRGMFLHPRQAAAALVGVPGLAAYRLVVDRHDHRDELTCEVVLEQGAGERVVTTVAERIRTALRFNAQVRVVSRVDVPGELADVRVW